MLVNDALKIIQDRQGYPRENDWELMEAAEELAARTKAIRSAGIMPPNMKTMRVMEVGEVCLFSLGDRMKCGMFSGATTATSIAKRIGMSIQQKTLIVCDPSTYESYPVVAVECLVPARPAGVRGKKKLDKPPETFKRPPGRPKK